MLIPIYVRVQFFISEDNKLNDLIVIFNDFPTEQDFIKLYSFIPVKKKKYLFSQKVIENNQNCLKSEVKKMYKKAWRTILKTLLRAFEFELDENY